MRHKIIPFIKRCIVKLERHADRPWYPPLLAVIAALDVFLVVLPTDGIIISSAVLARKRWVSIALWAAVGSTLGSLVLERVVAHYGYPWVTKVFPDLLSAQTWVWVKDMTLRHGKWFVLFYSATPLAQQPIAILCGLLKIPFWGLLLPIFVGRSVKSLFIAYAGAKAPWLLEKFYMKSLAEETQEIQNDLKP